MESMINADESTPDRLTPERLDITFGVLESEMDFLKKNIHTRKTRLKKFTTMDVTMWKCFGDTIEQKKQKRIQT